MEAITSYLQANIVLVLFLVVGLGFVVGKIKIGSIALGGTTGVLIVGIIFGLLHLDVPPIIKGVFFTLYLFVLGIKIGPGFMKVLTSRAAFKYLAMCLAAGGFMAVTIYLVAKSFGLNSLVVGGLSSGAMTTSAVLGAAQGLVSAGGIKLPEGFDAKSAANLLGSAYAITYLYGTFGLIILMKILPKLVGKNIAEEAAKFGDQGEAALDQGGRSGNIRAWRVTKPNYIGKGVSDLEAGAATHEADQKMPASIEKILRDGQSLEIGPDLKLQSGDIVSVWATPEVLAFASEVVGDEVTDPAALAIDLSSAELVVTNKELEDKSLAELVHSFGRGVTIERMARRGLDLPLRADLNVVRGDVMFVSGPTRQVHAFADKMGYVVTDQMATDLVTLGLFLAIFGALGTITVTVFGLTISVLGGSSIGAMVGGAILGWLRSRSPRLGSVATPAVDALAGIGLAIFIAAVAIGAGGSLVAVLKSQGPILILAGFIVTTACTVGTFMFGHFILRLNVAENAGATCGAMTGVAIGEIIKDAKSSVPAVAYALPSAFNNLTFTLVALILMSSL
jgi:putative transport protein